MVRARGEGPEQSTGVGIHGADELPDVIEHEYSPAGYLRFHATTVVLPLVKAMIRTIPVPQDSKGSTHKIVTRTVCSAGIAPLMRPIR